MEIILKNGHKKYKIKKIALRANSTKYDEWRYDAETNTAEAWYPESYNMKPEPHPTTVTADDLNLVISKVQSAIYRKSYFEDEKDIYTPIWNHISYKYDTIKCEKETEEKK